MPAALSGPNLAAAIVGYPLYLGTIDATGTSKTNHQATTAFNNTAEALKGKVLLIYNAGSVDIRLHPVAANDGTTTNTPGAGFGIPVAAASYVTIRMGSSYGFMACITTSSTADVHFWEMM